jgi:hypothetical protein
MKKLFGLGLLFLSIASHAETTTISGIVLNGIAGNFWKTGIVDSWILGVSNSPTGPLINNSNTTITDAPFGTYWLFADSLYDVSLGTTPELQVYLSNGSVLDTFFSLSGQSGVGSTWSVISGSNQLSLGWAQGTADLVGTYGNTGPDGVNDFYLKAQISSTPIPAVPEPEEWTMILVGVGMISYQIRSKRRKAQ